VRVRPDGTDLEVFATGLRNPFDMAMDPALNLFTRDNTNDGGGWDVRVFHLPQTSNAGYTQLYANFTEETLPPLGTFGGGSGTGVLWIDAPNWPETYRDALYTADWGRNELYQHRLKAHGASFDLPQEAFLKIPRPTGIDMDATGQLFVASWRGGEASVYLGPTIGFVARVVPKGYAARPLPNLRAASLRELVELLEDQSAKLRLAAQRELLSRDDRAESAAALLALARRDRAPLAGRAAAIFTLKQIAGAGAHQPLLQLAAHSEVREFALRALTDRRGELAGLEARPLIEALADRSPRVRAQAVISLARLGDAAAAPAILPLTARPEGSALPAKTPVHAQPDADRVLPHLAVRALVSLGAVEACLAALDGPHRAGALLALRSMHDRRAVEGLIRKLGTSLSTEGRNELLVTLIRLYHREADYDGSWWGIRPDNAGPYWDPRAWEMSERIGAVITSAILDADEAAAASLRDELDRHQVVLAGLPQTDAPRAAQPAEPQQAIVIPAADPKNPDQIGNLSYEAAARRALAARGDVEKGRQLFARQSCSVCHTDKDGQTPKGPHLVDLGKRYQPAELVESILTPSAKLAQGFETWSFETTEGKVLTGFIVRERAGATVIRQASGLEVELKKEQIEFRKRQELSSMPDKIVDNLTPEQLADLLAYLRSLE
jgi:putative heme-binding domain-containing protein